MLGGCSKKECVFADVAELFARTFGFANGLARSEIGEGGDELRQDGRRSHRNVVRANYSFHLRSKRGEAGDGIGVGVQIGFGAIEPNGRGIVGVAREQKAAHVPRSSVSQANPV